jgi:hypothetical protein
MLESIPPLKKKSLADLFPMASADALDLITRTLQFNPDKRLSGAAAAAAAACSVGVGFWFSARWPVVRCTSLLHSVACGVLGACVGVS